MCQVSREKDSSPCREDDEATGDGMIEEQEGSISGMWDGLEEGERE